jgi:hypothetical protein
LSNSCKRIKDFIYAYSLLLSMQLGGSALAVYWRNSPIPIDDKDDFKEWKSWHIFYMHYMPYELFSAHCLEDINLCISWWESFVLWIHVAMQYVRILRI